MNFKKEETGASIVVEQWVQPLATLSPQIRVPAPAPSTGHSTPADAPGKVANTWHRPLGACTHMGDLMEL